MEDSCVLKSGRAGPWFNIQPLPESQCERTFNSLALGEVAVLVLGEETGFVAPDDPLEEPVVYLCKNTAVSKSHAAYVQADAH